MQIAIIGMLTVATVNATEKANTDPETGLILGPGFDVVKNTCTACHSSKLVIQNRATIQGWREILRQMQKVHGLQQLDAETEQLIVNYLSRNYAPESKGRRVPLVIEQWYTLE